MGVGRGGGWLVGEGGDGVLNFVSEGVSVMLANGRDGRGTVGRGEDACFGGVEEEAEGRGAFLEFAEEEKCIFEVDRESGIIYERGGICDTSEAIISCVASG